MDILLQNRRGIRLKNGWRKTVSFFYKIEDAFDVECKSEYG